MFGKSSEVFGNLQKFSENFGNGSKVIFRCFDVFFKFSGNRRKCSEIFGKFPYLIGNVRNGSQELRVSKMAFEKSSNGPQYKLLRAGSDGIGEWNTTRCILPAGCIPQNMQW